MYGTSAFADRPFGARPLVWRLIFDAAGLSTCAAHVVEQGSGVATAGASVLNQVSASGRVAAMFLSSGALSAVSSLMPMASAIWNAGGVLGLASQTAGAGGGVSLATGLATGAGHVTGYRMRAYDQAFPANPSSGSIVQIGVRLFEWKVSSARWHPFGPVP